MTNANTPGSVPNDGHAGGSEHVRPSARTDTSSFEHSRHPRRSSRMSRRDSISSNMSRASFIREVDMAQDEMFSGPVSDNIISSAASFAHRRTRKGSTASFQYFDVSEGFANLAAISPEQAVESDDEYGYGDEDDDMDLQTSRRRKHLHIRDTIEDPLLDQAEDGEAARDEYDHKHRDKQEIYILTEDLRIAVGGFRTSKIGRAVYYALSVLTFGIAALLFRWLPRWRIFILGKACPFVEAEWLVVENQWGELSIHPLKQKRYGLPLSTVFGVPEKAANMQAELDEINDPVVHTLRFFDYRYIRFCFHPIEDRFILNNGWKDPNWVEVKKLREGVDAEEVDSRRWVFGENVIDIEEKSTGKLLIDEVFHPFYVFQIASLILWSIDEYYIYASCIFIISAFGIISTLIETKQTMKRMRELARFVCSVRVLRNGFWRQVESHELVPGDVFEISDPSIQLLPCDALLLSGDCIVNESMLTGESVPISKLPCTNSSLKLLDLSSSSVSPEIAKHFLFCGTKIIRARKPQDGPDEEAVAVAMVVRTGFNTTKGALVRSMLFPKPSGFKFYRDSFYYIGVMGLIAGLGFIASFINFVELGLPWHLVFVRACDLITIIVPPALPATLTIGTNFAISRLKGKQIFCISPQRVNIGGKLDIVCFDKTGTLTEDGLDVLGVQVVEEDRSFGDLYKDITGLLPQNATHTDPTGEHSREVMLHTMATCHSLRVVDDELIGDPLDQKMFEFTKWNYAEGERKKREGNEEDGADQPRSNLSPPMAWPPAEQLPKDVPIRSDDESEFKLGVHRQFEFVSHLRRASVIVKKFKAAGGHVYVKGAPEVMKDICKPESFPKDYDDLLAYYTHGGYRVIACATKHIPKLSWVKTQKMKRSEAESDLEFIGFIIFENKLKPQTTPVIAGLERAAIRTVMCTGDNILTAISVGRECGLVDENAHIFVPRFTDGDYMIEDSRLEWESVNNPDYKLDGRTLAVIPPSSSDGEVPSEQSIKEAQNYSLAVTGDVFRWVVDYGSPTILNGMLTRGAIFARMSPDEKHELVECLQSIDYCVGFCGDGANDCGALKAADVGISLSEAEASVAAPFTSRVFDISCVPEVIREGRASLVTSFSCFKYMSLYSAIQFSTVSILYKWASNLGDFQFLYIDLFLILPIAVFMGWSGPHPHLSKKRPTASLISRKVLTPIISHIGLAFITQFVMYLAVKRQTWYKPPVLDTHKPSVRNSVNTVLFLVSCFQYIAVGLVLNKGRPFRKPMTQNAPFLVTILAATCASAYLTFGPPDWLANAMDLTETSVSFRFVIIAAGLVYLCLAKVGESWGFVALARAVGWARSTFFGYKKDRKKYKLLLEEQAMGV